MAFFVVFLVLKKSLKLLSEFQFGKADAAKGFRMLRQIDRLEQFLLEEILINETL